MRKPMLWLLAALFGALAAGCVIILFVSFQGLKSVIACLLFAAIFCFAARHFALLAIHWRPTLGPAARMRAAEEMKALAQLPTVAKPVQLKLRPGEVCYFQAQAKYFPDGDRGTWMNKPVSYPGWFSITDQRISMGGQKSFTVPIGDVLGVQSYQNWRGLTLRALKGELLLIMNDAFQVPRILELMGISPDRAAAEAAAWEPEEDEEGEEGGQEAEALEDGTDSEGPDGEED